MGTAGELIKVYPLLRLAEESGLSWCAVHSGQSGINYWKQWDDFRLPRKRSFSTGVSKEDLTSPRSAMKWFFQSVMVSKKHLIESLRIEPPHFAKDLFFVHGDTLSTLLGATYAQRLGMRLIHVEAGLRSRDLFQPFPEEINRRLTSEMAHWHMAPDETAKYNLLKAGFEDNIINTRGNTLLDTIRRVLTDSEPEGFQKPSGQYAVANLHRHENLSSEKRWKRLMEAVFIAQKKCPVYFSMHAPVEAKLNADIESRQKLLEAGVQLMPRMKFTHFIRLLNGAQFVLSDGGSNQEECFYLGKPCLILRETTERVEGLGKNAVLSGFNIKTIRKFIENPEAFKKPSVDLSVQPCNIIFESLGLIPKVQKIQTGLV